MKPLVAKRILRSFDLCNLIGDRKNVELARDKWAHALHVIFVKAHNTQADEVRNLLAYRILCLGRLERRAIFAIEFTETLFAILYAARNVGYCDLWLIPMALANDSRGPHRRR